MNNLFKKHWITLLGAVFMFLTFSYLFRFAVDNGWISNQLKIMMGIVAGTGFAVGGAAAGQKGKTILNEILSGLGTSLIYTTFAFAGIYYSMWSPMTVFLLMVAVTLVISIYSFKFDLRILMNVGLLGGLIAPLVMKSESAIFTLFLYLLVINSAAFYVSVNKKWSELRLIPFLTTWMLFSTYYLYYQPDTWQFPFKYAAAAFIFYVIGFVVSSWKDGKNFNGLNLYLGISNGIIFGIWSLIIMNDITPFSTILGAIGLVYVGAALVVYGMLRKFTAAVISKFFGGLLLILIAVNDIGTGLDIKPMISVYIWASMAVLVLIVGQIKRLDYLKLAAITIWVITAVYWYYTTWATPIGNWFGTFIPILNFSGMAWVLLAAFGFYVSVKLKLNVFNKQEDNDLFNYYINNTFSLISHVIVGGLLTFQIDNLWENYKITFIDLNLTYSITWGIYALFLFIWGAYSKQAVFRWFGSGVLILVAAKTIFIDLSSADTIAKILVLFILSVITFAISYINNIWKDEKEELPKKEYILPLDNNSR
ncbi:DUF2339 domain-containing protein [Pseudobacteroides cellulosolvens]|uniref:DUF2339 domain-containing protein n=1 Tax=Pseudobacteroides cellulosolvens ATCC 35603 = DSM 2933 TaxID=398512 RepID=A0A0L6JHC4_9FIRM|nr:DUF2339 domain-containing protein [Pseudobacteroides cellulosolvens]KNY25115.1 Protein of unknown function DUF2339, transmembrane [Pseudobacteroides cellulosolvens ATCC 35603 = DSM 2933]